MRLRAVPRLQVRCSHSAIIKAYLHYPSSPGSGCAARFLFVPCLFAPDQVVDELHQERQSEWLRDINDSKPMHFLFKRIRAISGDQNKDRFTIILPDLTQQLKPRHARDIEVADHYVESLCCQHRKGLGATETNGNGDRSSHGFAQPVGKCGHKVWVIVNQQDSQRAHGGIEVSSKTALCYRISFASCHICAFSRRKKYMGRKKAPTGFRKPVGEMCLVQARPHPVRMRRLVIANPNGTRIT